MSLSFFRLLYEPLSVRLKASANLRKIISNIWWLVADNILRMGTGLFVGVWLARYLGPKQFGILSYAIGFVGLFGALATLGLDKIVVRNIVRDPSSKNRTLGTAFLLKLAGAGLSLLIALFAIATLRPDDSLRTWLVGILAAGMIFQAFDTIDFWFQSQVQSKFTFWAKNTAFAFIALVKIALILIGASIIAFAVAGIAEIALGALGLVIIYQYNGFSLKDWHPDFRRAQELLKECWPLILSATMVSVYIGIDKVMLGQMVGDEAVGLYSAAVRISEIWYFIPMIIATSVFPSFIKSKEMGELIYQDRIQKYYDLNAVLAYIVAIPASLFAPFIISTLYGDSYAGAETIFSVHIWACVFVFTGVARGQYLINEGLIKFSFCCTLIGAVSNIGLNLILIPKFQGVGAAIATVVSYALAGYVSTLLLPSLFNNWIMQSKSLFIPITFMVRLAHKPIK